MRIVLFDNSETVAELDIVVKARIAICDLSERFIMSPAEDHNLRHSNGRWISPDKTLYEQDWTLADDGRWHLSRQLMTLVHMQAPSLTTY